MEGICWGDVARKSQGMTCWEVVLRNLLGISIKNQGLKGSRDSLGSTADGGLKVEDSAGECFERILLGKCVS